MSAVTASTSIPEAAPDVRGPSAPLPSAVLASGSAALSLVLGGTVLLQLVWAISGGSLTRECVSQGLKPAIVGARGVCNIVSALTSPAESILLVITLLLGVLAIAVGFATYARMDSRRKREQCLTGAVLGIQAVAIVGLLQWYRSGTPAKFAQQFLNFDVLHGSFHGFLIGAKNTLVLALSGEIGGIVIGLILSLLLLSERRAVRAPARVYVNFFRGTPLIWQLSVFYFGFLLGLQIRLSPFVAAAIVFALNTGAYAAEVFRAGIQSIERGQVEAARSLGMSYLQAMRYAIVPQAIRRVIPPLLNEFVILIKDTALVIVLGLLLSQQDLYNFARSGYSSSYNATFFVGAAIGYLVITLPLIGLVNAAERRLRSGLVGVGGAGM
jgi:His/Glu/Gln/Arg/opine family amino acid ABC transporter permease subunit